MTGWIERDMYVKLNIVNRGQRGAHGAPGREGR